MKSHEKPLEEIVLSRVLRLNATINGIVTGIVAGLVLCIATNWLILKGGEGTHLKLLRAFFIGYSVTPIGSLIGFFYAFICGFAAGYIFARMYNWIVNLRERKSLGRASRISFTKG
jgi:hypothetical protein